MDVFGDRNTTTRHLHKERGDACLADEHRRHGCEHDHFYRRRYNNLDTPLVVVDKFNASTIQTVGDRPASSQALRSANAVVVARAASIRLSTNKTVARFSLVKMADDPAATRVTAVVS